MALRAVSTLMVLQFIHSVQQQNKSEITMHSHLPLSISFWVIIVNVFAVVIFFSLLISSAISHQKKKYLIPLDLPMNLFENEMKRKNLYFHSVQHINRQRTNFECFALPDAMSATIVMMKRPFVQFSFIKIEPKKGEEERDAYTAASAKEKRYNP